MNQSRLGEFFAPLVESLGLTTSSSKGDPLDILEDEIANERKGSSDILSKHAIESIEATASVPLDKFKEIEVKDATRYNRKRSSSIISLGEKEKARPKTSPMARSLSSLTILGSKKSPKEEKEKSMSRVRSASTVQLSEVSIITSSILNCTYLQYVKANNIALYLILVGAFLLDFNHLF